MKKPLVIIARNIPKEGLEELYKHCRVSMPSRSARFSRAAFLSRAKQADAMVTHVEDLVDAGLFRACPRLKIVANYAVGYDNMDLAAVKKAGAYATNTPGGLGGSVAEHAMGMILVLSKKMLAGDRFMRANKYKGWDPNLLLGNDVRGKTLGIIGVGNIGSALVKIAQGGFGMDILYHDVVANREIEKKYKANIKNVL